MADGLDPEEKGWSAKHPIVATLIIILFIAVLGGTLKYLQMVYFPAEQMEFETPEFLNQSFNEVDSYFNMESNLTEEEQEILFEEEYKYNVVKWTCRPISCQEILNQPTLKLICKEHGFTEDVRVAMKEDCTEEAQKPEVTVVFQLISRTSGEYYLGRSGRVAT